jgi:trehalose/maltose hydrolase-like predicted phosphorylase
MRRRSILLLALGGALAGAPAAQAANHPGFVLSTTQPGGDGFAPAFVGNGYLAGRQPADGQGFALVPIEGRDEPLRTQSEVHGLYAVAPPPGPEDEPPQPPVERRAALPAWSTLSYDDGSGRYSLDTGHVDAYRQALDVRTGTLTTDVTWTSPAGRTVDLTYEVTPDRAHAHAAMVRLTFVPHFDGTVSVTDLLDGQAAELVHPAGSGRDGATQWVKLSTVGLGMPATVASVLRASTGTAPTAVPTTDPLSSAQKVTLTVQSGQRYRVVKSVGVAVGGNGGDSADPTAVALAAARDDAALGYLGMRRASDAAWARLWASDVEVLGDTRLRAQVRSSLFSLFASVRDDVPWAPSPGGLSSDGYNGHVFWDSETWMFPTLLATAPDVARQSLQYRADRLAAAEAYAAATGWDGARFPWESALSGGEETPAFADTGKLEIHISADIALAAWQYYLATGDRDWLESTGWPLLSGIATFWASRATPNADGSYSILDVIPPDEYAEHVDDSVYTNVGARDALQLATQAAQILGRPAPPEWAQVADHLRVLFDPSLGIHPEYAGYPGNAVKQADVTLLAYPWENPQPDAVTQSDLDYYVPRTDPGGPSMTDAVHSILSSQLGTTGCPAFSFTRRSVDPFMRAPYYQFSEARTGGAFTFTTGAGGFLQEFLYGYTGFRWRADRVQLAPSLPPQLRGITVHALHWQGRVLRIAIRPERTRVTLVSGDPLTLDTPGGSSTLGTGETRVLPTRRPDLTPTDDLARCKPVTADPPTAEPAEAGVDGSVPTQWIGETPDATLQVDLGSAVPLGQVTVTRNDVTTFPAPPGEDQGVTRPTVSAGERVEASTDGSTWRTVGTVTNPTLHDVVPGDGQPARYVRVVALDATDDVPLIVGELAVTR